MSSSSNLINFKESSESSGNGNNLKRRFSMDDLSYKVTFEIDGEELRIAKVKSCKPKKFSKRAQRRLLEIKLRLKKNLAAQKLLKSDGKEMESSEESINELVVSDPSSDFKDSKPGEEEKENFIATGDEGGLSSYIESCNDSLNAMNDKDFIENAHEEPHSLSSLCRELEEKLVL